MCLPEFPAVKRLPTHSPHIFFSVPGHSMTRKDSPQCCHQPHANVAVWARAWGSMSLFCAAETQNVAVLGGALGAMSLFCAGDIQNVAVLGGALELMSLFCARKIPNVAVWAGYVAVLRGADSKCRCFWRGLVCDVAVSCSAKSGVALFWPRDKQRQTATNSDKTITDFLTPPCELVSYMAIAKMDHGYTP